MKPDLQDGDVVLLKDPQVKTNHWPMGVMVKTYPSSDERLRKADVKIVKDDTYNIPQANNRYGSSFVWC